MSHFPRRFCVSLFIAFAAGILLFPAALRAQTEDKSASAEKPQTSAAPKKPVHKPHVVTSNDSIVRLAERPDARAAESSSAQSGAAEPANAAAKESASTADDPAQRKAEIAALEKQIAEKRKRVELLMRLFVTDEKAFLKDPLSPEEDAATQERRKYEQQELLWEGSEVARLQARLEALKALPNEVRR